MFYDKKTKAVGNVSLNFEFQVPKYDSHSKDQSKSNRSSVISTKTPIGIIITFSNPLVKMRSCELMLLLQAE